MNSSHEKLSLIAILEKYETLYKSNPIDLVAAIPSHEIWRFFIDGYLQNNSRLMPIARGINLGSMSEFERILFDNFKIKFFGKSSILNTPYEKLRIPEGDYFKITVRDVKQYIKEYWKDNLTDEEKKLNIEQLTKKDRAWIPFEKREPGYLQSMYTAFGDIFDFTETIDNTFIQKLHLAATEKTKGTQFDEVKENIKGQYRFTGTHFGLSSKNMSFEGFKQVIKKIQTQSDDKEIVGKGPYLTVRLSDQCEINAEKGNTIFDTMSKLLNKPVEYLSKECSEEVALEFLYSRITALNTNAVLTSKTYPSEGIETNTIISHAMSKMVELFHTTMKVTDKPENVLRVIISFVQDAEQLHPFVDGNCRTFCMLLLNHLLMKYDFPPAILDDPNQFDGFSVDELMQKVIEGMNHTLVLAKEQMLHGINTKNYLKYINSKENDYFTSVIQIEDNSRKDRSQKLSMDEMKQNKKPS